MKAQSKLGIRVDFLNRTDEVGELARLAARAGWVVRLDPAPPGEIGYTAYLERQGETDLDRELGWLVLLEALASDRSPHQVLERAQNDLIASEVNMTESFQGFPDANV